MRTDADIRQLKHVLPEVWIEDEIVRKAVTVLAGRPQNVSL
jgi:hypothetical protein